MDLTGHILLDKYEVKQRLGEGGMATVYRARHRFTGREVALKVLDEKYADKPRVRKRFGREARAASAVQHPGIVEVLDLDATPQGLPFLVMELLRGETLAARIERSERLEEAELLDVASQLLEALDAAHQNGVVHRDLKPENIFLVGDGRGAAHLKILDFGISQQVDELHTKLTRTGSVLGTPHYMSPEQASGEDLIDYRTDIFSAGTVLYECAVGDVPFTATNYNQLLRMILDRAPPSPRERGAKISVGVERVILWALEKDRNRRVQSAKDMLFWLKKAASGVSFPYPNPEAPRVAHGAQPASDRPSPIANPSISAEAGLEFELPIEPAVQNAQGAPALGEPADPLEALLPQVELEAPQPLPVAGNPPTGSPRISSPEVATPLADAGWMAQRSATGRISRPAGSVYPARDERSSPGRGSRLGGALRFVALIAFAFGTWFFWLRGTGAPGEGAPLPAEAPTAQAPRAKALPVNVLPAKSQPPPLAAPPPSRTRSNVPSARVEPFVNVEIVGLPPGARLRLDGIPATSPLRVRAGSEHALSISAPGYAERTVSLSPTRDVRIHSGLRPEE